MVVLLTAGAHSLARAKKMNLATLRPWLASNPAQRQPGQFPMPWFGTCRKDGLKMLRQLSTPEEKNLRNRDRKMSDVNKMLWYALKHNIDAIKQPPVSSFFITCLPLLVEI